MLPGITWTIAGRPVPIQDFSAGAEANLGFGQMRGTLRASDVSSLPRAVRQGARIRGSTDDGRIFYQGRISASPNTQRGLGVIAAQGEAVRAVKRATRLLHQSRDPQAWEPAMGNPHNYVLNENKYHVSAEAGRILFSIDAQAYSNPEANGVVFWAPGSPSGVTRIAFSWRQHEASNHQILIQRSVGPSGALTNHSTVGLGAATSGTTDTGQVLTHPANDQWALLIQCATNHTPPVQYLQITDLRVNGVYATDTLTGSQVVADAGARLGYDTSGVGSTTLNVLPLDWTQGSWADLLTYMANLEDRVWGVWEDDRLTYEAWGEKEWTCYQAWGAKVDLIEMEIFNGVTVKYRDVGGADREVTVMADPDPLEGFDPPEINLYPVALSDVQADSTFATAVANQLLPKVSTPRLVGRVETPHLWDSRMRDAPYEGKPGNTLRVPDFFQGSMRIASVDYTRLGVSLGIEAPVSAFPSIRGAELERLRSPSTAQLPELPPVEGPDLTPSAYREQWGAPTPTRDEILAAGSWDRWKWLNRK